MIDLAPVSAPATVRRNGEPRAPRPAVFVSGEGARVMAHGLGGLHYSYRFVEDGYSAALAHAGLQPVYLAHPEGYARPQDLPADGAPDPARRSVHIGIRSTENFRLCRPSLNVQVFAWEFDVLREHDLPGDSPFHNQLRMLKLADEVWTLCAYSKRVLERSGVPRVRVIPSPIRFQPDDGVRDGTRESASRNAALAHLASVRVFPLRHNANLAPDHPSNRPEDGAVHASAPLVEAVAAGQLFLSILNPHDLRKNLAALLLGFHAATQRHPNAVLLVKLSMPAGTMPGEALAAVVRHLPPLTAIANPRILLFTDYLDDRQLEQLYRAASYYITSTLAEGQNLPLMEAMAHGCLAVSPAHTAMGDYLDAGNAVVMDSRRAAVWTPNYGASHARRPFAVDRPSPLHVARAVDRALRLPPGSRRRLAAEGARRMAEDYSVASIAALLAAAMDDLAGEAAGAGSARR